MEYTLSHTINPSFAVLTSEDQFVYLETRIGKVDAFIKDAAIAHVDYLNNLKKANKLKGYLQLRRLFFDEKGGSFSIVVDHLIDDSSQLESSLLPEEEIWVVDGQPTYVDFKAIKCSFVSDHFDKNHRDYYASERIIPWITDFDQYILQRNIKSAKAN